jgi:hypothetical protein
MTELEQLEHVAQRVQAVRDGGPYYRMHNGQLVRHPQTGELLPDPAPAIMAIELLGEIAEAVQHLTGNPRARDAVITATEAESRLSGLRQRTRRSTMP